jgi:hypothetical protein
VRMQSQPIEGSLRRSRTWSVIVVGKSVCRETLTQATWAAALATFGGAFCNCSSCVSPNSPRRSPVRLPSHLK